MPGALSHHHPQVPSIRWLLQHQRKPYDGEETVQGRLKPGREAYLPVQKGCDQTEVLWMLHEPAGTRGRGLVWVPALTPLADRLPCPARPKQRGQLPEGLRGLRKYLSAAQLPRKTGTLNLAQWSQAGRELRCTYVHHRVGEGRGTDSAQHRPSPCSIPRPPKPVPLAGQTQRAARHLAEALGFGKGRARNRCQWPSTSTLKHGRGCSPR